MTVAAAETGRAGSTAWPSSPGATGPFSYDTLHPGAI